MSVDLLAFQIKAYGLPEPVREFRFHPERRWRSDLAWPDRKLLVEFEGGIYSRGRHVRGKGYENDLEKYNAACELGYLVLRYSANQVKSAEAVLQIQRVLLNEG